MATTGYSNTISVTTLGTPLSPFKALVTRYQSETVDFSLPGYPEYTSLDFDLNDSKLEFTKIESPSIPPKFYMNKQASGSFQWCTYYHHSEGESFNDGGTYMYSGSTDYDITDPDENQDGGLWITQKQYRALGDGAIPTYCGDLSNLKFTETKRILDCHWFSSGGLTVKEPGEFRDISDRTASNTQLKFQGTGISYPITETRSTTGTGTAIESLSNESNPYEILAVTSTNPALTTTNVETINSTNRIVGINLQLDDYILWKGDAANPRVWEGYYTSFDSIVRFEDLVVGKTYDVNWDYTSIGGTSGSNQFVAGSSIEDIDWIPVYNDGNGNKYLIATIQEL